MTALRWLAFGDLGAAMWGMAWVPDGPGAGRAVIGAGPEARVVDARLEGDGPDGDWRLVGDGVELTLSPAVAQDGPAQLVRTVGRLTLQGSERSLDAYGWRGAVSDLPESGKLDSLRLLAAWFDGDEGLALVALRPRKARGQEGDEVSAALVESGGVQSVTDARLSTTYAGRGEPSRAGVELWVSEPSEEPGAAGEHPHRVAGEASAAGAGWTEGSLDLMVHPFRWHSHGRDGPGVYVLGRPR